MSEVLKEAVIQKLKQREVLPVQILEETKKWMEEKYKDEVDLNILSEAFKKVLLKDEVADIILSGIFLDESASKMPDDQLIKKRLTKDANGFNVDEILAIGITNQFSAAATVHYGWLDNTKPGIIREIDARSSVNVFLDDIVAALIASTVMTYLELQGGNHY
jgi:phosphatidylglycerophosphatase A